MSAASAADRWCRDAYPECIDSLRRYLQRFVPSTEMAEDIAHDAFLRVYTAPGFGDIGEPRGYLFRTGRNLALNALQRHAVSRTDAVDCDNVAIESADPVEHQAMTEQEFTDLCRAIAGLPERRRRVVTLRAFYEWPCDAIGKRLGISRRTAYRELAAALETIHAQCGNDLPEQPQ